MQISVAMTSFPSRRWFVDAGDLYRETVTVQITTGAYFLGGEALMK